MYIFSYIDTIDRIVSTHLFSLHTRNVDSFFSLITLTGNTEVVILLATMVSVLLYFRRNYCLAALTLVGVVGSTLSTYLLKFLFARPRPELLTNQLDSFSLPSGHATGAMALYGILIYIAVTLFPKNRYRYVVLVFLPALILLIGFSRIYLGYHYLSDVIVGYGIGLLWLLFSVFLFNTKKLLG